MIKTIEIYYTININIMLQFKHFHTIKWQMI